MVALIGLGIMCVSSLAGAAPSMSEGNVMQEETVIAAEAGATRAGAINQTGIEKSDPAKAEVEKSVLEKEVARRRTFAIISHPDAGKTTLTEKLLLYAGAIEQAGAVRARKHQRAAVSDWMAIEQERGISITSTV